MTTSTIELMKAAIADAGGNASASYLNIVTAIPSRTPGTGPGSPPAVGPSASAEITRTRWGAGIRLADDLVILTPEADEVPAWMAHLDGDAPIGRLRPMHPDCIPSGLTRSWRYLSFLRRRPVDPETFHRFLAADTVVHLRTLLPLAGTRAADIGDQDGFMAEALREEGVDCHAIAYGCQAPEACGDDRSRQADGGSLPIDSGQLDLAYCSDVLQHVERPDDLLDEMVRVLVPGTGIGYLAFTNGRSPVHLLSGSRGCRRVGVGQVLAWFAERSDVEIIVAEPRYLPGWAWRLTDMPGVREVATGSLRVVFRRVA